MRGLVRRQYLLRTRAELHRWLSPRGREFVADAWQAAEGIFTQLSSLGPLTTVLGRSFAASYADTEALAQEFQHAFFVVMMAGYASRTVLAEVTAQIASSTVLSEVTAQPSLDPQTLPVSVPRLAAWDVNQVAEDPAAFRSLADRVWTLTFSEFESVMSLPPNVWAGYVSLATMQLQRNLESRTLPRRELNRERIEGMLRYGYVLRCLDEVADVEPELREDSPYASEVPDGRPLPSDDPGSVLSDDELAAALWEQTTVAHVGLMSADAERQIRGGPIMVLGQEAWDNWNADDHDGAVISCRTGFMMRLAELQLLPEASERDHRGWIAVREFIRETMRRSDVGDGRDKEKVGVDTAIITSAAAFTATRETTESILGLMPGPSSTVREAAFGRGISLAKEKGAVPAGLGDHDQRKLMIYGYALSVVRELLGIVQEQADAGVQAVGSRLCEIAGFTEGDGPAHEALAIEIAMVGAEILVRESQEPDFFPAAGKETERRGMELLTQSIGSQASANAAIFLAHALLTSMALHFARLYAEGKDTSASREWYLAFRDQVLAGLFPLSSVDDSRLGQCAHLYRAFDGLPTSRDWPQVPGYPTPFSHGAAFELRSQDSVAVPAWETAEGMRWKASHHFIFEALKHAIHISIGTDAFSEIRAELASIEDPNVDLEWLSRLDEQWTNFWRPMRDLAQSWLSS